MSVLSIAKMNEQQLFVAKEQLEEEFVHGIDPKKWICYRAVCVRLEVEFAQVFIRFGAIQ